MKYRIDSDLSVQPLPSAIEADYFYRDGEFILFYKRRGCWNEDIPVAAIKGSLVISITPFVE